MSIPKLYSFLPEKDGNLDISSLTDHNSITVDGSDGEKYLILSYFPEKLKYSSKSNVVFNKYVLFILNGSESKAYDSDWSFKVFNGDTDITHEFNSNKKVGLAGFECQLALQHNSIPETDDWEFRLNISCQIKKDTAEEKTLEISHTLLPIAPDLLPENGASFEDESGLDNSSVFLGNEGVTHFVRGHLGEYLVAKNKELNTEEKTLPGKASNDASVFVNDTAALIYNNILSVFPFSESDYSLKDYSDMALAHTSIENSINKSSEYPVQNEYTKIGLCSLNLHHVHSFLFEEENARVPRPKEGGDDKICLKLKSFFDTSKDEFVELYLKSVFPKSAINLSVSIFDQLFQAFQKQAGPSDRIYETYQSSDIDKNATIDKWKKLNYSELPESDNTAFMKNLLSEYYHGHLTIFDRDLISKAAPQKELKIDWSQFIQKLLNPSSVSVPFTLIKIQVLDLRSGKPIKNAVVNRIEFQSFMTEPDRMKDQFFTYMIEDPHDSELKIKPTDSRTQRVQKIGARMGYYSGKCNGVYNDATRALIYKYMTSSDRLLYDKIDAPESASKAHVDTKKSAWLDYIIEDFTSNCITDDDGILNCRIPDELLENGKVNINVGFAQFAVTREIFESEDETIMKNPPIKRPYSFGGFGPTKFMAHWVGDPGEESSPNPNEQDLNWENNIDSEKNFGWKITEGSGMEEGTETSSMNQLRVAISLEVKRSDSKEYSYLKMLYSGIHKMGYKTDHFSTFFKDSDVHFVLFGMQWCQPVWDEWDDKEMINGTPKHAFIQDENFIHPHMHLVTNGAAMSGNFGKYTTPPYYGVNENYGGKGYGKHERNLPLKLKSTWRGGDGHLGYDINAKIGANVFALHYGEIKNFKIDGSKLGRSTRITWEEHDATRTEYTKISYGHLGGFVKKDGDNVIAGTIVAKGGRAGNIDDEKPNTNPSHVHLGCGGRNDFDHLYEPPLRKTLDKYFPENAMVIPNNSSPLLYPCRGEMKKSSPWEAINTCDLKHKIHVQWCWAAGELKCPYIDKSMNKSNENLFQLIIQLRYLNEQPPTLESRIVNEPPPSDKEKSEGDYEGYKVISEPSDDVKFLDYFVDKPAFSKIDKNTNYFHPGQFDKSHDNPTSYTKEYGTITKVEGSTIPKDTVLAVKSTLHSKTNHALHKVEYEIGGSKKTTWIEKGYIGTDNKLTETLKNVPSTANKPSKARMSVYCFKKQHNLLDNDNYYQNFETDDKFWEELNKQCGF